jgi:hypothetical protein
MRFGGPCPFAGAHPASRYLPIVLGLVGVVPVWAQDPGRAILALPAAATGVDAAAGRLRIELPPQSLLPGRTSLTPVYHAVVPFDVSLYGFAVELLDERGIPAPRERLHHVIMTDPERRDLFAPLALPIFGASKESPSPVLPRYLVGVPLPRGDRYLVSAMLMNPESRVRRYRVRLILSYLRPGAFFPLLRAYPWTMDVTFPLGGAGGRHDFDVPVGRSRFSWEGSPSVPCTVLAVGGHAHDFATALRLVDVTTGDTLWRLAPVLDSAGRVLRVPVMTFYRWNRLGLHLDPAHRYRLTGEYDNPLDRPIRFGGMASVVGLAVPDRGTAWPRVDRTDPIYRAQLHNLLANMAGVAMEHDGHGMR